ncbi:MAG: RDD family protein [Cellulomonas sp.]|nr:RDD family protein [Cellulomonas sp.]
MTVAGDAQVGMPPQSWAPAQLGAPSVPYASWGGRVLASLLDGSIGGGVAFLTLGPNQPTVPFLGPSFLMPGGQVQGPAAWTDSGWLVVTVVVAVLMQAYLGATPGKLLVGIAVVGDDYRPVGLVRTVLRSLAHLIDAILLIGYLRPLWNAQRLTFADSILSTQVLQTRRPWPHRWLDRGAATAVPGPLTYEALAAPRWWPAATALSAAACTFGALFSVVGTSSGGSYRGFPVDCVMITADDGLLHLQGGNVTLASNTVAETRLWITKTAETGRAATATWTWSGTLPDSSRASLRVEFTRGDGSTVPGFDFPMPDASAQSATIDLPARTISEVGPSWTARQTVVVDGVESPACVALLTRG